ncbi:uncharacterized protein LOC110978774 isoform X2 [Acanthaster planci]|uniref:Uncharacterized protein LOC110978774 isoform X2 n=1 Tax=Acanthaster planci TaxID=133434 RepID=A0A8B7Y920_ACAPL|nr:uncharacterized protein LOC110978774 isoform X2 [Acanthaster planci]
MKGQILVYSIVGCPHCMKAKSTLNELNLPYVDVSVDKYDISVRKSLVERTGKRTVPQVFFNSHYIGGNDDLQELIRDKESLQRLIQDVEDNEPPADAPEVPDPSLKIGSAAGDEFNFTCELDECALLVKDLKESGLISDNRRGLKVYKNTFVGREFVDWIVKTKDVDRERAVEIGQALIEQRFGHDVKSSHEQVFEDSDRVYRLIEDDPATALNQASELGEELRKLILDLYNQHLTRDGKGVDYPGIKDSPKFQQYVKHTAELVRVDIAAATREEKLAFFINVYNALVIHANVTQGPPTNIWQRYKFFNRTCYIIGGHIYSLQDIENGVLRGNRKGIGQFSRPFSKSDPRFVIALETPEPLIHFALVCGARSCPPIKTYSAKGIYDQLKLAAEAFLESSDGCLVLPGKNEVRLSKIFQWYKVDFGGTDAKVVQWVYDHIGDGEKKMALGKMLSSGNFKTSYLTYNWSLNSKHGSQL